MDWLGTPWSLPVVVAAFVGGAAGIGGFGYRLVDTVDRLADRTGLGEAIAGAVLLGGATSLSGVIVSVVAAADGNASLAVSNGVSGIAGQTAFIVVADLFYRRANIEHAAASLTNVFNALLLVALLSLVLMAVGVPTWGVFGVHPMSVLIVGA